MNDCCNETVDSHPDNTHEVVHNTCTPEMLNIPLANKEPDDNNYRCHAYDSSVYSSGIASEILYEGASITVLDALVRHFTWFSEHPGISKDALSDMLHSQHHHLLPYGNKLPASYEVALNAIEPYLVKPIVYHACPNDCILFRSTYSDLSECPLCQAKRYIGNSSIPAHTFTYLPLGPRLSRVFGTASLAALIQSHGTQSEADMYDIHDSPSWKKAYGSGGVFGNDKRGISLAFCTDGVNPFNHIKVTYSMWPIMLTILNLPRSIRNHFGNFILVGIIPGNGSKEAGNLNPYLEVVVDELLELNSSRLWDAYRNAPFNCKIEVLLHVLDYPGLCKVFSVVGSGAYSGCAWCHIEGM